MNISLTVSPFRDAAGNVIGASKIARDITEQKQIQEALRKANQALTLLNQELEQRVQQRTGSLNEAVSQMEEFAYGVSHDLRSPVRAMQGYARALLEDYGDRLDEPGRQYLQKIMHGSVQMYRLIEDVLTYARVARHQIQLQPVSLDSLVRELVQHYPEMQPPRAEVVIRAPLLPVLAHELSLTQALANLMNNAIKFVAPGTVPRVELWTERRSAFVRLWVKDNGIGIKPEQQSRLFSMFERAHTERPYEGTGIGLAIVRKALEKMGGAAGVQSDGIHGAAFWIELPAAEPAASGLRPAP